MAAHKQKIGWIGVGRMGYQMVERLAKANYADLARLRAWINDTMVPAGKVSPADPGLVQVADDPADVVRIIVEAHSLNAGQRNFTDMT